MSICILLGVPYAVRFPNGDFRHTLNTSRSSGRFRGIMGVRH